MKELLNICCHLAYRLKVQTMNKLETRRLHRSISIDVHGASGSELICKCVRMETMGIFFISFT